MGKEIRVNVRVAAELKERLRKVIDETKISETSLAIACLEALCDYFEEHGEVTMPLVVKPKSADRSEPTKRHQKRNASLDPKSRD
jgi:hypothetical protein